MGSYDISLKGSNQILTPNIDALGYQGVIFKRHYTESLCTPSRAAFLTGKSSIHIGLQSSVILSGEPRGLPIDVKILPEYLKEIGYRTHIVGKWHLGIAKKDFIPTHRGFDSHTGHLGEFIDYFDFTRMTESYTRGFDFRCNESVYRDRVGQYATDVLTDEAMKIIRNHDTTSHPLFLYLAQAAVHAGNSDKPLQALARDVDKINHIRDPRRRLYAAMVKALDRSVGEIVQALDFKGILENTIIVFFSDNGGPTEGFHSTGASNFPLRGQKDGPWEGGLLGTALIWSPFLQKRHYVSNHVIHITDWLPTFLKTAGYTWSSRSSINALDGHSIWPTLTSSRPLRDREIVHNIDTIEGYTSYYTHGWKYINGTMWEGKHDSWLGNMPYETSPEAHQYENIVMNSITWRVLNPFARMHLQPNNVKSLRRRTSFHCQKKLWFSRECKPREAPCLFNVHTDPCEVNNVAHLLPDYLNLIQRRLQYLQEIWCHHPMFLEIQKQILH
uniref:Sulfatase N-terminal domain-containing protein n=1 Tax=Lutzomyia longipalpis TaxID=7200 RepID=A0A1B0CEG6_LUTLO